MLMPQRVRQHERIKLVRLRRRQPVALSGPCRNLRRHAVHRHPRQSLQELHQQPVSAFNRHPDRSGEPVQPPGQQRQTFDIMADPLLHDHRPSSVHHTKLVERAAPIHTGEEPDITLLITTEAVTILHLEILHEEPPLGPRHPRMAGLVGTSSRRSSWRCSRWQIRGPPRLGRTGLHLDLEGNTSAQVLTETAR